MPLLDRFLTALTTHRASALLLAADEAARLQIDEVARPITKQPLTDAQLRALLREVAPPEAQRAIDAGAEAVFAYRLGDVEFRVRSTSGPAGLRAEVVPAVGGAGGSAGASAVAGPSARPAPAASAAPSAPSAPSASAARVSGPVRLEAGEGVAASIAPSPDDARFRAQIEELLAALFHRGASDLHLRIGEPPILRLHGEMVRLEDHRPLEPELLEGMLRAIMPERNRHEFAELNDTDFAHEIPGVARFRCNALRDRKGPAAVFRVIPARVVTVEELGLSEQVQALAQLPRGLVLVTGPTGSGKSTTLCSLIDLVNRTRSDHVITIEDPIEFVHENKKCIITQRQVGVHTSSFKQALRAALREDPDIILVGELRDLETVSIAIETAETGHLVFGTLHTTGAVSTVDRLIDQFPPDQQAQIRVMLADSLKGVISQVLCRKIGGGRVAAREILLSIPAISNLIREGKTYQIPSILQTSKRLGMVALNDALIELVDSGQVEPREAYLKASDKQGFAGLLRQRGHDTSFLEAGESATAQPAKAEPARSAAQRPAARAGA
jgi:twitching motility protein PilT